MLRKKKMISFSLLLAGVTSLLLSGCGDKIEPGRVTPEKASPVKAHVATAVVRNQPFVYDAVGTVHARTASTLSAKLMGTVRAVHVKEGDVIKKGDVLVEIDARQVSAQLRKAQAALAEARQAEASARSARDAARAGEQLARATYQRYLELMKQDSASQQEFDEIEARYRRARSALAQTTAMLAAAGSRVQQAEAAVAAARVSKKDVVITAPYDGKVTAKMVSVGDLASPGTPLLTLEKTGLYCVDLVLPERHIQSVHLDQTVRVTIPALAGLELSGRVGRIVPAADQKTRSFLVKVALPEQPSVRSGMFARVAIPIGDAGMLLIPASAIVRRGQLTGIFMVDDNQTARFRLIRTGRTFGDTVEVISGLKAGQRYVVSPPPKLVDGVRVEVAP